MSRRPVNIKRANIKPANIKPSALNRPKLGLFHTAPSHVPRFTALLRELAPRVEAEHIVYEDLLSEARVHGVDAVAEAFTAVFTGFAAASEVVLCTCSTFGAHAERLGEALPKPVVRIDRPLARAAVAQASSIVIVAALESTLKATLALFEDEAAQVGKPVIFTLSHAADAWGWFERGDESGYLQAIATHVDNVAERGDVVALAQASMAGAEALVRTQKPVLSSPKLGVLKAVELLERVL